MASSLFTTDQSDADTFRYERSLRERGFTAVAGSDEAGRGPLAGPVVAATVILPPDCRHAAFTDSKQLAHKGRLEAFAYLRSINSAVGIGIVSERKIDEINILQASLLAMKKSCQDLMDQGSPPDFILVDGKFEIPLALPQQALIKGESKSSSIAAASIAAKITRDAIMDRLHEKFPAYGFAGHEGYPTRAHKQAKREHGQCRAHRRTFRGVREFVK